MRSVIFEKGSLFYCAGSAPSSKISAAKPKVITYISRSTVSESAPSERYRCQALSLQVKLISELETTVSTIYFPKFQSLLPSADFSRKISIAAPPAMVTCFAVLWSGVNKEVASSRHRGGCCKVDHCGPIICFLKAPKFATQLPTIETIE